MTFNALRLNEITLPLKKRQALRKLFGDILDKSDKKCISIYIKKYKKWERFVVDAIIQKNKQLGETHYPSCNAEVIDVKESAPNTYTIILGLAGNARTDISQQVDLSAVQNTSFINKEYTYFPVGSGIGVPPPEDSALLTRIVKALKPTQHNDKDWCKPYKGYAGPDLATPSTEFLKLVAHQTRQEPSLSSKQKYLEDVLQDPAKLDELQATYDVADILEIFPNTVSAEDLWDSQPKGPMTRTYTIIPEIEQSKIHDRPCFSISVKAQKSKALQRLFGEAPQSYQVHEGIVSDFLCSLNAGDILSFNKKIKKQKAYKAPYEPKRDVVFVAQGNAYERSLSYLYEKQAALTSLKEKFIIVSAFKRQQDIPLNDTFDHLAKDGTLTKSYHALSRDKGIDNNQGHNHYRYGQRVHDVLQDIDLKKLNNPVFYIAGSTDFCNAVEQTIATELGENADIRISNSPNRIRPPSIPHS